MAGKKNANLPLVWHNTQFKPNGDGPGTSSYASAAKRNVGSKLSFKRRLRINLSPASPLRLVGSPKFMSQDMINRENVLQIIRMGICYDHAPRTLPAFSDTESRDIALGWKNTNRNRICAQIQAWLASGKNDVNFIEHFLSHDTKLCNDEILNVIDGAAFGEVFTMFHKAIIELCDTFPVMTDSNDSESVQLSNDNDSNEPTLIESDEREDGL
jgi:hypothetical protein